MSETNAVKPNKQLPLLVRGSIWVAIGALVAAAIVCVVWVMIGDQDGLIGRAFLTILLLAGFAGVSVLDASLADRRPDWFTLISACSWVIALIIGALKIWLPETSSYGDTGGARFMQFLLSVGILQLAVVHVRLFTRAAQRLDTAFTRITYYVTLVFLAALVAMLLIFLTFPQSWDYPELYWRFVVALTILVAVGTTILPLINALFAPKKEPRAYVAVTEPPSAWPTYADGRLPLPALADGTPDWEAYRTGFPTPQRPPASNYAPPTAAASLAPPAAVESVPTADEVPADPAPEAVVEAQQDTPPPPAGFVAPPPPPYPGP